VLSTVAVLGLLAVSLIYQMTTTTKSWRKAPAAVTSTPPPCAAVAAGVSHTYLDALARQASLDRYVVLAMVDAAFVDMAVNLYETSLRPNAVDNFLFVGVGRRACDAIANASLPCFRYADDAAADTPSVYLTPDFVRKMNIRTDMIIDALTAGFTVVHTDLDVVFFRNPLPHLKVPRSQQRGYL